MKRSCVKRSLEDCETTPDTADSAMQEPPRKRAKVENGDSSKALEPTPWTSDNILKFPGPSQASSQSSISFKPFRWGDLPGEIKNRIYEYALTSDDPIHIGTDSPTSGDAKKNKDKDKKKRVLDVVPNLLALNKQTYAEAAPIFYSQNAFHFADPESLVSFLRRLERPPAPTCQTLAEHDAANNPAANPWRLHRLPPDAHGPALGALRTVAVAFVPRGPHVPHPLLEAYWLLTTRAPRLASFAAAIARTHPFHLMYVAHLLLRCAGGFVGLHAWLAERLAGITPPYDQRQPGGAVMERIFGTDPRDLGDGGDGDGGPPPPPPRSLPNDCWGRHFFDLAREGRAAEDDAYWSVPENFGEALWTLFGLMAEEGPDDVVGRLVAGFEGLAEPGVQ